ncbi:hypothetical protein RD792_005753 [Penstemon davidsonii]|uniref:Uncharacterized protein n=1 Tax=Penstemon davidsonii TaxID=160366 RepID=A0ABR0DEE6_9LAMI|nr:hypothetical protein RD792_005753 [Penstemon davidsonii]
MGYEKKGGAWLEALYVQKFFAPCSIHYRAKKKKKNICCLDCCISICPHCVLSHRSHRLLQIRRYVYHEVVRLEDLENLMDCSNIQCYRINGAKVVFIKKRAQNNYRQLKGSGNYCTCCDRTLQEPFLHCSLGCKVDFVLKQYKDISPFLRLQLGPDLFIPQDNYDDDIGTSTNEITTRAHDHSTLHINMPFNMSSFEFVRKKRSSSSSTGVVDVCGNYNMMMITHQDDQDTISIISRRKGIPHRSPLC